MNLVDKHNNPFELSSGAMRILNKKNILTLLAGLILLTLFVAKSEIMGLVMTCALFVLIGVLYSIFQKPKNGIYLLIVMGFFVTGATRYVMAPWGLIIDGLLVLIYIALFFKGFAQKIEWSKAKSQLTLLAAIWMGYVFLELGNPEVISREAWFYAMRGVGLYQILAIPLLFLLFNTQKDLHIFFILWGCLSLLGSLKGIQQWKFGVDLFEQRWLEMGGAETHLLFGKLRVFSFYSDAGQFGASQGHAGVVFGVLALFKKATRTLKVFFWTVALAGFLGMIISGTRGALAVPALGGIMFMILRKNLTVLAIGGAFMMCVFIFFAYTTIGQGNAEIRRMRTAFDPDEASLQVRLNNQKKLKSYLASRPFGGGLGATGNWGLRFTPHTFLANTATDSWYVMIWADTGVVGLVYYLFMIFFVLITGAYNIMVRIKNKELKVQMIALASGMAGIMMASYGNGVFGQMPTGILMYGTMVFLFLSPKIDRTLTGKEL